MSSKDFLNFYLQLRQIKEQKRIGDEIASAKLAAQRQSDAVLSALAAMQLQQQEQSVVQYIAYTVDRLLLGQELEKLHGIIDAVHNSLSNAPDSRGRSKLAIPEPLSQAPADVSRLMSLIQELEAKTKCLRTVSLPTLVRHNLEKLEGAASLAAGLLALVDELGGFQEFVAKHSLAELRALKAVVAPCVAGTNGKTAARSLSGTIARMREYFTVAQKFLEKAALYDGTDVPGVVRSERHIATEILATCDSFWVGKPASGHLEFLEQSLGLRAYLATVRDEFGRACQTVARFSSRHNESNPLDLRRVSPTVTAAQQNIREVLACLQKQVKNAASWPAIPFFTKYLKRANHYNKLGQEILNAYDELPKLRYSSLAILSFVFGLLSLSTFFFTGIPAVVTGHFALREIQRRRGKGLAIGGLVLGYAMTIFGIILLINGAIQRDDRAKTVQKADMADFPGVFLDEKRRLLAKEFVQIPSPSSDLRDESITEEYLPHVSGMFVDYFVATEKEAKKGSSD